MADQGLAEASTALSHETDHVNSSQPSKKRSAPSDGEHAAASDDIDKEGNTAAEDTAPHLDSQNPPLPNEEPPPLPNEEPPPLPNEEAPPLPSEPVPELATADGANAEWSWVWEAYTQQSAWYHHPSGWYCYSNGFWTQDPSQFVSSSATAAPQQQQSGPVHHAVANGYNPAIHGDYDPNADYAQGDPTVAPTAPEDYPPDAAAAYLQAEGEGSEDYVATAAFNRFTGRFQTAEQGPEQHDAEHKAQRQMAAHFDVNRAANEHDGRSLKAERQARVLSKKEVREFREKKRRKKEEKRRAWATS